jgi:hypothetical protein
LLLKADVSTPFFPRFWRCHRPVSVTVKYGHHVWRRSGAPPRRFEGRETCSGGRCILPPPEGRLTSFCFFGFGGLAARFRLRQNLSTTTGNCKRSPEAI